MINSGLPVDAVIDNLNASGVEAFQPPTRKRRIKRALAYTSLIATTFVTGLGVYEETNFKINPTTVVAVENPFTASLDKKINSDKTLKAEVLETQSHNKLCFILSGFGLDLTKDYVNGIGDTFASHCQVARVVYSNAGIKTVEITNKIQDYISANTDDTKPVDVSFYGGSMGGLVSLNVAARLLENDKTGRINVSTAILDSSPSELADIREAPVKVAASIGSSVNDTSLPIYGLRKPMSWLGEMGWRVSRGNLPNLTDVDATKAYFDDVNYLSDMTEPRLAGSQAEVITSFMDPGNLSKLEILKRYGTKVYYFRAEDPQQDLTIDVEQASRSFSRIFPKTIIIKIPNGKHASPNVTAEYNPAIDEALRLAGDDTIHERAEANLQLSELQNRLGALALHR